MSIFAIIWWISVFVSGISFYVAKVTSDDNDGKRDKLPVKEQEILDKISFGASLLVWFSGFIAVVSLFLLALFAMIDAQV